MSDEVPIFSDITDQDLEELLRSAIRNTLIFGVIASLIIWKATNWRDAAMMATGAAISAASIIEWRRLARFITAKMDKKQTPRGSAFAVIFFLVRLLVFAGVIYVSLKCFQGSVVALLCGLALAVLTLVWGALHLLRG
jgi:uncharacterized membrane protein